MMALKADQASSTTSALPWSEPKLSEDHLAEARFEGKGDLQADPHRHVVTDIDGPSPPSGHAWLLDAAKRLAAKPESPARVTSAARELAKEMLEAFLRRRVNEVWTWPSIKNFLTRLNLWPSSRKRRAP